MKKIFSLHKEEYGTEPEVVTSAPGTINLMGEYTEFSEGFVLSVAIDRYIEVAVSRRTDNSLRFYSVNYDERKKTTISNLKKKKEDRWANYPKGVISSLLRIGCILKGVDITIMGNIPEGIGLASSSALAIALTVALKKLFELELSEVQIIEAARQSESVFLGQKTGISSFLLAYYAKVGHAMFLDTRSLEYEYIPLEFENHSFLITDTRIPPSLIEIDDEIDYYEDFKSIVKALSLKKSGGSSLRDFSKKDLSLSIDGINEDTRRRSMHVMDENQRVLDMKGFLQQSDMIMCGRLLSRSHESLRNQFDVSCPELDWLVKRAQETQGVYGSRLTGKGYGGCTVTLIDNEKIESYEEHLEEYERIFGFKAEDFICKPSMGVKTIFPEEG
ncbi:MAG: galactokinase [Spirochaetaceae bacterium]|nr:galactokinase [Spirochaetaceae bacterium]